MKITSIKAIEILDSRGKPTVRSFVTLEDGSTHASSVPSGASTGSHEAVELRDGDTKRHQGQGVLKAVENVNTKIATSITGSNCTDPQKIDEIMIEIDGTENKSNLGANAILSVSQAVVRAAAHTEKKPLWKYINEYYFKDTTPSFPRLMVNVVNGGKHAGWNFDIQEFMVVPTSNVPSESTRIAAELFHQLGKILKKRELSTLVGDEGGYSPALKTNEEVFQAILVAGSDLGYSNTKEFNLAIDAAASEFYEAPSYVFKKDNKKLSGQQLIQYYKDLQMKYKILSFEDPFAEDDWKNFQAFSDHADFIVVGDDLFVTNTKRIKDGIEQKAANAVLIKVNQIGSVKETVDAIKMTKQAGWKAIISHRSGETEDPFIADLAYAAGADFIKTGSMSRSERLAKYNRLLEIEANL